jgi:O-antigen ligase
LETFLINPINGQGAGTDAANVVYKNASNRMQNLRDAHQMWLNVAAESGILGLAAVILIAVFIWRNACPFLSIRPRKAS